MLELKRDGVALDLAGGRGDALVAIEERGLEVLAVARKFDRKRNFVIELDQPIPTSVERLGHPRSG
jgi:hypothetical protein